MAKISFPELVQRVLKEIDAEHDQALDQVEGWRRARQLDRAAAALAVLTQSQSSQEA